ncbi:MAG TPA: ATP-binding protein [Planctomycetota bacterium]|nr:ATP-binding protein [Planctomycetota bacterium]
MSGSLKDRLTVANDTRHLLAVRDFTSRMARHGGWSAEDVHKIVLAIDEAVTNIIEHGYNKGERGTIEIEAEWEGDRFQVVIRDSARVFNPESIPAPDMAEHVKAGRKKGLGLFLMRQIMDEVRYRYKDGVQNELTLVKFSRTKS